MVVLSLGWAGRQGGFRGDIPGSERQAELSRWRDRQVERFLSRAGAGDWEPVQGGQWPVRKERVSYELTDPQDQLLRAGGRRGSQGLALLIERELAEKSLFEMNCTV